MNTTEKQPIHMVTGQQTGFNSMAKFGVIVLPFLNKLTAPEQLFLCEGPAKGLGIERVAIAWSEAAPGYIDDFGKWATSTYFVPDNTAMVVQAFRSLGHGSTKATDGIGLVTRKTAALRQIRYELPAHPNWAFRQVTFEGRFDIKTLDEFRALGIRLNPMQAVQWKPGGGLLTVTELEPETAPAPMVAARTVTAEDGQARQLVVHKRRRGID